MRARQRHFNAGRAGAKLVLDARFISSVSDGSAFSPWSDISGNSNDGTQATSSRRPTYRASASNGLPSVEGNAANSVSFGTTITTAFTDFFCQVIYKDLSGGASFERLVDKAYDTGFWMGRNAATANSFGGGVRQSSPPYGNYTSSITDGTFGMLSIGRTSSTKKQSANGTEFASVNVGSTALSTASFSIFVGTTGDYSTSQISQVVLLDLFPSDPLLKRLQHASAYSFKIACS